MLFHDHDLGADQDQDLAVLHRNAPAEKFHLVFTDGRLVVSDEATATDTNMASWMAEAEVFNRQRFRDAFALSGSRAVELLAGFVRTREGSPAVFWISSKDADNWALVAAHAGGGV